MTEESCNDVKSKHSILAKSVGNTGRILARASFLSPSAEAAGRKEAQPRQRGTTRFIQNGN
jgi:hypothetical protein